MQGDASQDQTRSDFLVELAGVSLAAFENIANAAGAGLGQKSADLGAMPKIDQATAEKVAQSFREIAEGR